MQKYELYVDHYENDFGCDVSNVEHIKDDHGDWCKSADVDKLQATHDGEIKLVRSANARLVGANTKLQTDVYILSTVRATLLDENDRLRNLIKDLEQAS